MQARGPSAAGLLLLLLCLVTRSGIGNANTAGTRRTAAAASNERQTIVQRAPPIDSNTDGQMFELLEVDSAGRINDGILALIEDQSVVPGRNNAESSLDQQVDQSEIILVDAENGKELDDIEHALPVMDYEPQRIDKKGKRRTANVFTGDPVTPSSDNSVQATREASNVRHEVPRSVQPKRFTPSPRYYPRSVTGSTESPEAEPIVRSRDEDNSAPVATARPRFFRTRSPSVLQTPPPTVPSKFQNPPPYRSHSPQVAEAPSTKQQLYTDPIVPTTAATGQSYSTRPSRRRNSRRRVADSSLAKQQLSTAEDNNDDDTNNNNSYTTEPSKPRRPVSSETRSKPRRLSLVAKYDVAPRTSSSSLYTREIQEVGARNSGEEDASPDATRGSNNENVYPSAAKTKETDSYSYSKLPDPVRPTPATLNRKLEERKDSRESSTAVHQVNSDPLAADEAEASYETESSRTETRADLPSGDYDSNRDAYAREGSKPQDRSTSSEERPATASTLDVYENTNGSGIRSDSSVTPYAGSNPYFNNYVYYPPLLLTTLAPKQRDETDGAGNPRNVQSSQIQRKKKRNQQVRGRSVSDGVAEATHVPDDVDEEEKDEGRYRSHGAPVDGYKDEYRDQRSPSRARNGQQHVGEYTRGGPRDDNGHVGRAEETYAQKEDAVEEEDVQSDSSHNSESHQGLSEGAEDGGETKKEGGEKKFEEAENTEQEEEHNEAEGEKGEKGYKSWHEEEKANKGHHDKERNSNHYDEEEGMEKEHKEEGGYHQEHNEGEKGEKQSEFDEKGEHQKGYSTKGQHSVHKKDEYEKRTEFFDDFHDDGEMEKDGEFYEEHEMSKGDNYKMGHHDEDEHGDKYGKHSKHEKGGHYDEHKGHKIEEGDDSHYQHEDSYGKKKDHQDGKKWSYKDGDDGGAGGKDS